MTNIPVGTKYRLLQELACMVYSDHNDFAVALRPNIELKSLNKTYLTKRVFEIVKAPIDQQNLVGLWTTLYDESLIDTHFKMI